MTELGPVLTVAELATKAGWNYQRMWRHLRALNDERGGTLLRNTSRSKKRARWTASLAALRSASPEWFGAGGALTDQESYEDLDARVRRLEHTLEALIRKDLRERASAPLQVARRAS